MWGQEARAHDNEFASMSNPVTQNVAIIGAGISGLTAAYYLSPQHRLTVFESAGCIGGHTATIDVVMDGREYAIDTGFIVYNDWTYPNFIDLLDTLGVTTQPTEMSFSVRCDESGLEYGGSNINTLFAQRRNFFRPSFYGMLRDILRFNREAVEDLDQGRIAADTRLGSYLAARGYGQGFIYQYLLPMGCAIWSASTQSMLDFPLLFFVRFFRNHGLLSVNHRPQWRVIQGGSRSYLDPLSRSFKDSVCVDARIAEVRRLPDAVELVMQDGNRRCFDQVVFACHSDQARRLLADATLAEQQALEAIPYHPASIVSRSARSAACLATRSRRYRRRWRDSYTDDVALGQSWHLV